jgi:catechol 2,3-dioxygenase-like lactoylglutathione lyase family enzyme
MISRIDHVQLAMPPGEEAKAIEFYSGILGMHQIPKPAALVGRGGAWFIAGGAQIHLGVEQEFQPAKKAHVAFAITEPMDLRKRLLAAGYPLRDNDAIEGLQRFFTDDAFGNRIEFIVEDQK